jgi:hypothetical protein
LRKAKIEDRPGRDAERVLAVLAAPLLAGGDEVVFAYHTAMRARHGLVVAPAHFPEDLERLLSFISKTRRTDRVRALAESKKCWLMAVLNSSYMAIF